MPRCTNKGCQKDYDEADNAEGSCSYHPGGPVFHEGLKSWSCCKDVNKPVLEFDQFMALPPCMTGSHSSAPAAAPMAASATSSASSSAPTMYVDENGVETYGTKPQPPTAPPADTVAPAQAIAATPAAAGTSAESASAKVEEDDLSVPVPEGAACKRLACGARWAGEAVSRGEGEGARCRHHPQPAVFHEGSKGYLCCKRRVLEFDEFLKIEGCTQGRHLFVGAKRGDEEELVNCRIDHYQTPTTVHVSAFAKNADKSRSSVSFTPQSLSLSLFLPGNKRVERTLTLYGAIDPAQCSFRILGSKVEILLTKPAPASWPLLELPPAGTELPPGYALTFGVSGRTGTVGGREIVLSPEEMARRG